MTTILNSIRRGFAAAGFALVIASTAAVAQPETPAGKSPETIIQNWPKDVQAMARMLIDRYGQPSKADASELVWNNNGPWLRTTLRKDGPTRAMLGKTKDRLEQTIAYPVPENKVAELMRFDRRLIVNRDSGELSSQADSEEMNYLALNLADDIVKGQKTAMEATTFAMKAKMLNKSGKSSPYLEGLVFTTRSAPTEEPMRKPGSEDYVPNR